MNKLWFSEGEQGSRGGGLSSLREPGGRLRRLGIAFGAERLGLIGLKTPVLALVIAAVLAAAAILGIHKISVDDSLSDLFRTKTPDFRLFEQVSSQFPSAEYDVLVVVEGKTLLDRDSDRKAPYAGHGSTIGRGRARRDFPVLRARTFGDERTSGAVVFRPTAAGNGLRQSGAARTEQ